MQHTSSRFLLAAVLALSAIMLVGCVAADHSTRYKFETFEGKDGHCWWRLIAGNGEPVASSHEGYTSHRECLEAVTRVRNNVGGAMVADDYRSKGS